jgi:hypothetical protein
MRRHQRFLFLFTFATVGAAVAPHALGQDVSPAIGPASRGTQPAAFIPNFSGVWSHPYWPGFEPPASGPGPITNRSRLLVGPQRGVGNPIQLVGDYTNPILKPEAAGVVKKQGEKEANGVGSATPLNQCWPGGVPFVLRDIGMQMLQQPDKIIIIYFQENGPPRYVRMNQPHPAQFTPSWYGDSVGYFENDTLVIDTVGVRVGPFAMVDMYGTPHTEALHVVERYRLVDYESAKEALDRNAKENFRLSPDTTSFDGDPNYRGKHLQLQFTVDDPGVFTTRWSATITYGRPAEEWHEFVCAENPKDAAVPHADKADF